MNCKLFMTWSLKGFSEILCAFLLTFSHILPPNIIAPPCDLSQLLTMHQQTSLLRLILENQMSTTSSGCHFIFQTVCWLKKSTNQLLTVCINGRETRLHTLSEKEWKIKTKFLLWLSNFLMMVSRKVFCGATWPLRTGIFAAVAPGLWKTLQDF